MYNETRLEYLSPQIEITAVEVEYTNISNSGSEDNCIDPVLENRFEEIL